MNPEDRSQYEPGLMASMKERIMPKAATAEMVEKAKERAGVVNEGQQLIDIALVKWDAELVAAARMDELKGVSGERKSSMLEAQKMLDKQLAEKKAQEKRDRQIRLNFAKGKIDLSELDEVTKKSVAEEQEMTLDEVKRIFQEAVEYDKQAQAQEKLVTEARGELPEISLSEDEILATEAEVAEEKMFIAGVRVLEALNNPPEGANDIANLREANAASGTLTRAETERSAKLDALASRLITRYPGLSDEITRQRTDIELKLVAERILDFPALEISTDDLADRLKNDLIIEENVKSLNEQLGVGEQGALIEGSLLDQQIKAEAQAKMLETAFKEIMEKAEADPRLADKALSVAILRHQAQSNLESVNAQVEGTKMMANVEEKLKLTLDAYDKEQELAQIEAAQKKAEAVADTKRKWAEAKAVPSKLFSKGMNWLVEKGRKLMTKMETVSNVANANVEVSGLISMETINEGEKLTKAELTLQMQAAQKELDRLNALLAQAQS